MRATQKECVWWWWAGQCTNSQTFVGRITRAGSVKIQQLNGTICIVDNGDDEETPNGQDIVVDEKDQWCEKVAHIASEVDTEDTDLHQRKIWSVDNEESDRQEETLQASDNQDIRLIYMQNFETSESNIRSMEPCQMVQRMNSQ